MNERFDQLSSARLSMYCSKGQILPLMVLRAGHSTIDLVSGQPEIPMFKFFVATLG